MSAAAAAGPVSDAAPAVANVSGASAATARCDNCGATVAGRYCAACGQRLEPPLHSLWHFSTVALEDLTHADSRLWRTLATLLVRPGRLTREFLDGRRAHYLPPVRLYLVISLIFFLWASATHEVRVVQFSEPDHGPPKAELAPLDADALLERLELHREEQHLLEQSERIVRLEGAVDELCEALAAGILSETEAAALRDYDRKVMDIINVDDFEPQELAAQAQPAARSSVHVA